MVVHIKVVKANVKMFCFKNNTNYVLIRRTSIFFDLIKFLLSLLARTLIKNSCSQGRRSLCGDVYPKHWDGCPASRWSCGIKGQSVILSVRAQTRLSRRAIARKQHGDIHPPPLPACLLAAIKRLRLCFCPCHLLKQPLALPQSQCSPGRSIVQTFNNSLTT